jgi:hypothetical protein
MDSKTKNKLIASAVVLAGLGVYFVFFKKPKDCSNASTLIDKKNCATEKNKTVENL